MEPNWSLEFAGFDQQKAAWKGLPWELCSSLHCWQWSMDFFCLCIAQNSQMWLHLYSLQHKTQSIVKSSQGTCEVLKLEKWKDAVASFSVCFSSFLVDGPGTSMIFRSTGGFLFRQFQLTEVPAKNKKYCVIKVIVVNWNLFPQPCEIPNLFEFVRETQKQISGIMQQQSPFTFTTWNTS